jgi:hypothetical protein
MHGARLGDFSGTSEYTVKLGRSPPSSAVQVYRSDDRTAAMVQFPRGLGAEIHACEIRRRPRADQ